MPHIFLGPNSLNFLIIIISFCSKSNYYKSKWIFQKFKNHFKNISIFDRSSKFDPQFHSCRVYNVDPKNSTFEPTRRRHDPTLKIRVDFEQSYLVTRLWLFEKNILKYFILFQIDILFFFQNRYFILIIII